MSWKQTDGGKEGKWEARVKPVGRPLSWAAFMLDGKNVRESVTRLKLPGHHTCSFLNSCFTAQQMWQFQPQTSKTASSYVLLWLWNDFQYMVKKNLYFLLFYLKWNHPLKWFLPFPFLFKFNKKTPSLDTSSRKLKWPLLFLIHTAFPLGHDCSTKHQETKTTP